MASISHCFNLMASMRSIRVIMVFVAVFCVSHLIAAKPLTKEYVSRDYKMAIAFPSSWKLSPRVKNEVWLASGEVRGIPAGCFVRVSVVANLRLVEPEAYFQQTDEKAFVKLVSMGMPDIRVHRFDFSYLGGRLARRIIYSGTDERVKVGNLVHQTLDADRIVTLTCFTEQQRFHLIYNDLDAIAASFRFLR